LPHLKTIGEKEQKISYIKSPFPEERILSLVFILGLDEISLFLYIMMSHRGDMLG
jgi:hypothetical protein